MFIFFMNDPTKKERSFGFHNEGKKWNMLKEKKKKKKKKKQRSCVTGLWVSK